jgi:polyhydroxyalkanoate synthesis regulator phasin
MKKVLLGIVLLGLGWALVMPEVSAEGTRRSPGVNRRERHERKRIKQGVKSGELTKEEAKELRQEQREIHQKEREMKSDGTLTKEERKELHQDINDASKNIYEEKHDSEKR